MLPAQPGSSGLGGGKAPLCHAPSCTDLMPEMTHTHSFPQETHFGGKRHPSQALWNGNVPLSLLQPSLGSAPSPWCIPAPTADSRSRGKWRGPGAPGRCGFAGSCTCGSGDEERGGVAFPMVPAAWECCAAPEAGTSLVRALSACVPSDQPGQFSQFQSMGNRNAVVCVQREPIPLPPSG